MERIINFVVLILGISAFTSYLINGMIPEAIVVFFIFFFILIRTPSQNPTNIIDRTLGFTADFLMHLCTLTAVATGGYMIYIWWSVIKNLDFLEFSIALALFFITIPVAPIYKGIHGDWEPAMYVGLGFVIAAFIYGAAKWYLDKKD
mgnify:CR=1 FL=1